MICGTTVAVIAIFLKPQWEEGKPFRNTLPSIESDHTHTNFFFLITHGENSGWAEQFIQK